MRVGDVARLAVLGQNLGAVRGEGVARGLHVGRVGVAVAEGAAVDRHDAVGVGGLVGHAEVDDLDGLVGRRGHKLAGGGVALDLALVGILVRNGGEVAVTGDDPALDAVLGVVVGAPDGVEGDAACRHRVGRGAEGVAGIAIVLVLNRGRAEGGVARVGLAGGSGADGLPRLGGRGRALGLQALGRVDGDLAVSRGHEAVHGVGPAHERVAVAGDIGRQDVARLASVGLERLVGEELDAGGRARHVEGGRTVHGLADAAGDEGQRVQVGLPVEDQGGGGGGSAVEAGGVAGDEAVVDRLPGLVLEPVAGVVVLEGDPGVRVPVLVQVGVAVERVGLHGILVAHVVPDARLGLVRIGDLVGDAIVGLDVGGVGGSAGVEQAVRVADQFAVQGQGVAGAVAGHGPALDVVGRVVEGVPDGVEGHGARVGRVVHADGGHDERAGVRAGGSRIGVVSVVGGGAGREVLDLGVPGALVVGALRLVGAVGDRVPGALGVRAPEVGDGVASVLGHRVAVGVNILGAIDGHVLLVGPAHELVAGARVIRGQGVGLVRVELDGRDGTSLGVGAIALEEVQGVEEWLVEEDELGRAVALDLRAGDGPVVGLVREVEAVGAVEELHVFAVRHEDIAWGQDVLVVLVAVGDGAVRVVRPGDLVCGADQIGVSMGSRVGREQALAVALDGALLGRAVHGHGVLGAVAGDDPALDGVLDVVVGVPDGVEGLFVGGHGVGEGRGGGVGLTVRGGTQAGVDGPAVRSLVGAAADLAPGALGVGALEVGDGLALGCVCRLGPVGLDVVAAVDGDVVLAGPAHEGVAIAGEVRGQGEDIVGVVGVVCAAARHGGVARLAVYVGHLVGVGLPDGIEGVALPRLTNLVGSARHGEGHALDLGRRLVVGVVLGKAGRLDRVRSLGGMNGDGLIVCGHVQLGGPTDEGVALAGQVAGIGQEEVLVGAVRTGLVLAGREGAQTGIEGDSLG